MMNKFKPNQACVNCHFFIKQYRGIHDEITTLVKTEERKKCRNNDYSWIGKRQNQVILCYFSVWDQGHNFDKSKQHDLIVNTNRKGYCFFYKYRPGMLLPAAKQLQIREAENRETRRDRLLTIIGLWIAAVALLVDVILRIVERLVN